MAVRSSFRIGLALAAAVLAAWTGPGSAAELKVLSSNAMTDLMSALIPDFEAKSGDKVHATFEPTAAIMERLNKGETADVIILIRGSIDQLAKAGKVEPGSEADLAKTSLALAVKAGTPKPDISTAEALKATLLKANVLAASEVGASGVQFRRILDKLGIADQMKPKLKLLPGAEPTGSLVAKGEADIAVQMMSELKAVSGAEIVGTFPGDLGYEILLTAALDKQAKQPQAGRDLIQFLASPATAATKEKKGMQPAQP